MRLAEIFVAVRPDARELPRDMRRALDGANVDRLGHDQGDKFTKGFGRGLGRLAAGVAGTLGTLALGRKIKESVDAASDLNETVNKSSVIFGKNAAGVEKWSRTSAKSFGLSKNEALAAAAGFGDMFSQLGFTANASAKMSKSTVQMAADLGSFNNLGTDDVLERISAGFRGEFDSLQAVIPNISAARVQTEALAATGKTNAASLTAQDKATAVLAIVQKDGARAMGDFARTSSGYANQQKIAAAQTADLKSQIGQGLLPVFIAGATALNTQILPPLAALATKHGPAVSRWLTDVTVKAGPFLKDFLNDAGPKFKSLADGTNEASPALKSVADSGAKLAPVVKDLIDRIPSLTDTLNVGASVIKFFADNTDTLTKIMPLLVAGIVAYKVAQLAANVAQLVAVPTKFAEVVVNRQLVKSNRELIASRAGVTGSTVAQTVATNINTGATGANAATAGRGRIATLAYAAAERIATIAKAAGAVAARVLGIAMTFALGPVGLIIAAVALLALGIVILWKRSETFRTIVTGVFNAFKNIALTVITFVWKVISGFFGNLLTGAAKAFGWVPGLGPKLKSAAEWFGDFTADVNKKLAGLKDQEIGFTIKYSSTGVNLTTPSRVGGLATGGPAAGKVLGNGSPEVDKYHYMLAPTEWVIRGKASQKYGDYAMGSVNRGTATIIPDSQPGGLAAGGRAGVTLKPSGDANAITRGVRQGIQAAVTPVLRSLGTNRLAGTVAWGKGQAGKPYGWGASGPGSYDCSGFVSALVNYAYGRSPYRRLGATGSMPWASMVPGTGPFMIGYFKGNPGHTAATINGINFESAGGVGTRFGPRARGAYDRMFTNQRKVKGFALGGRPGGGREGFDGDLPFDLLNPRGSSFLGRDFLKEVGMFDNGGVASGTGLIAKGTIAPERMLDPQTTRAFEELVQWLRGNGGTGGPQVHNHFPATTGAAAEEAAARFLASLGGS